MAGFSIKVNRNVLEAEVFDIIGKKPRYLLEPARAVAEEAFPKVLNKVLTNFDRHPVTRELRAGPDIDGSILPFGNLFSFLGFYAGQEPTVKLRAFLKRSIELNPEPTYNRRLKKYYFKIDRPTKDDIADETADDLEWGAYEAWPNAIEEGVSNLSHYLFLHNYNFTSSRSGSAIQKKQEIHPGADFGGTPYLSQIWEFLEQTLGKSVN